MGMSTMSALVRNALLAVRSRGISSETPPWASLLLGLFSVLKSKICLVSLTDTGFNLGLEDNTSLHLTEGGVESFSIEVSLLQTSISQSDKDESLNSVVSLS